MRMRSCSLLWLLCMFLQSVHTDAACNIRGRFGRDCKFQCHCVDNTRCNQNRLCGNGTKCERGWFGPSCQYQDLLASPTVTSEFAYPWLSDDDVTTCNNDSTQSITLQWNISYPITWIRIQIPIQAKFRGVNIDFSSSDNITYNCNNNRTSLVKPNIKDIYCNVTHEVTQVTLRGADVAKLCSIYISGGRNLAVYQNASQSSDYSDKWLAINAVDGNWRGKNKDNSCSHTAHKDDTPTWSLSFSRPYLINRYVLYNRIDRCCQKRLTGFLLTSFDSNGNLVLNRTGPTKESNDYVVTAPSYKSVKKVNIRATFKDEKSGNIILSLCEVETFGDCEFGWFGLHCQKKCYCTNNNCDISGNCMEGSSCVKGMFGPACQNLCNKTYFGENCQNKCPVNCLDKKCHPINGSCFECIPGYRGVRCNKTCEKGFFGAGCMTRCSTNCGEGDGCDPTNGKCLKDCAHGYQGATCNEECSLGQYGQNCAFNCSEECLRNVTQRWCNVSDGMCLPYLNQRNECQRFCVPEDTFEIPIISFTVPICLLVIGAVTVAAVLTTRRVRKWKRGRAVEMSPVDCTEMSSVECTEMSPVDCTEMSSIDSTVGDNNLKGSLGEYFLLATSLTKSNGRLRTLNENIPGLENTSVAVSSLNTFLSTHSSQFFMKQYNSVPEPVNVTHDVAHSDTNRRKNRYLDVCPYDHSRVPLQINGDTNEGDYINASYIEAYRPQDLFIAAQGPNASSLPDFVRMLWEQRVGKVVMLTNMIEDGQVKCERYWPDEGTAMYGEISVNLKSVQVFAAFTIRKLHLIMANSLIHHVTQFHFTSWPDKGVPSSPWSLVDFQQRVVSLHTTSPVVVHCSAGVGRTGTFIALCNVLAEAEDCGRVNFFKELVRMRQNRVMMIQKTEQYVFLHQAAQVAVVCSGTAIRKLKINKRINSLVKKSIFKHSRMFKEFQNVCTVFENFQEYKEESCIEDDPENDADQNDEQSAQEVNNDAKNRFPSITPQKSYIAELTCESPDMGKYINAVLVPNFTKMKQQILTQLPMPNTVVDFWRLVMEYNVTLIVAFEADYSATDKINGHHLPSKTGVPLLAGPFEIQGQEYNMSTLWEEYRLSVRRRLKSTALETDCDTKDLVYLQSTFTNLNPKKLLVFTKQVKSYGTKEDERILYMCRNGASYSGLVCVLSLLMNRLDEDGHLTVPLIVGAIKSIRPEVIATFVQYKVLYQAMQIYNNITGVYDDGTERRDSSNYAREVHPRNDNEDLNV